MKRFTRIMGLLFLIIALSCTTVFAAGQQEAPEAEGPVTLSMWTLFSGGEGEIMTGLIEDFNASQSDYIVEEQIIEWAQYYNKLLTSLLSGDAPDIGIMHLAVLPDYASRGVLNPLDKVLSSSIQEKILPNIIEKARYEGSTYALPIDTHAEVLYYNKSLLADMGTDIDSIQTWDDLIEAGRAYKQKTGKIPFTMESSGGNTMGERLWVAVYSQMGGRFEAVSGKLKLDRDLAVKTYAFINDLYKEGIVDKMDYNSAEALFMNNESPFHMNGVWAMTPYPQTDGLDFGVRSIPALSKGAVPYTWGDSHSFILPKNKNGHTEGAAAFIEFFSGKSYEWASAGHLPVNKSVLASDEFLNMLYRKDYKDVAEQAVLAPSIKGWAQIRTEMFEICDLMLNGDMSPEQAGDKLLERIADLNN